MADQAGDPLSEIVNQARSLRESTWMRPAEVHLAAATTAATANATAAATAAAAAAAATPTPVRKALPPTPESSFGGEGNCSPAGSDNYGEEEGQAEEGTLSSSAAIAEKIKHCKDLLKNYQADPHPFDKASLLCQISRCAETLKGCPPGGRQQHQKQQQQQQKLNSSEQIALSAELLETAEALQLALEEAAEVEKLKATIKTYEEELAKKEEEERKEKKKRSVVAQLYAWIKRRQKRGDREPRFWPETELHGLSGPIRDMAMAENYRWLHEMHRRVAVGSDALRGRD